MRNVTARLTFLVAAVSMLITAGCGGKGKETAVATVPVAVKGVALQVLASASIPDQIEAVGTVRARNSAQIAARIPGTVSRVLVREGDRVGRGKLLVTLQSAETVAGAAGAKAGVDQASRSVEEARARKQLADVTLERYSKLLQEQAVTRQEFDTRLAEQKMATQGFARAEAGLVQASEGAKAAGAMAGYNRITAPISGIVISKQVEVGMTVFPGAPLLTVEEEGNYRLEVSAPETLLGKAQVGQKVAVAVDGAAAAMTGRIAEIVPTVDPASRTFTVKVDVDAKGLRSGSYGRVLFPVGSRQSLLVPKGAVVVRGALTSVWVVDKQKVARMRLVNLGKPVGDQWEALSGLSAGEQIVTAGVEKLVDGATVE